MQKWHPLAALLLVVALSVGLASQLVANQSNDPPPTPTPPSGEEEGADQAEESDGEVIRIGPGEALGDPNQQGEGNNRLYTLPGDRQALQEQRISASRYYIGLGAVPVDDALRAHVDLPEGAGLLVEQVYEGSPADEAGVERYDIVVSADGQEIRDVAQLVDVVNRHGGDNPSGFTLDLIRHGDPISVTVTPTERPTEQYADPLPPDVRDRLRDRLGRFRGFGDMPFGPRMVVPFDLGQVPGGVSISIERKGDGPAKITVRRGGESWEIEGDDPEALEALPDDLRPMVESMLERQNGDGMGQMRMFGGVMPEELMEDFNFEDRMLRMEEQIRRLQRQLEGADDNE